MPPKAPFQLLELNVMSGQDLAPVMARMKTYAVAWVHPDHRLTTQFDSNGHNNPTWNDKFVFRVNDEFLRDDSSAVMVEIYACHWFRDIHIGTVRVLVGNLIPLPARPRHRKNQHVGMRFVALQVRRPSGRPQGILNIGVAVLDSSMRSMPLYSQLSSSAVGYRDLMGEDDSKQHNHHHQNGPKPTLRRSRSDRSDLERMPQLEKEELSFKASSAISGSEIGAGSKVNRKSKYSAQRKKGSRSKVSSVVSGSSVARKKYGKPNSMLSGSDILLKGKHERKQSSTITGSEVVDPSPRAGNIPKGRKPFVDGSDMGTPRTTDTPNGTTPNKMHGSKIPGLEFGAFKKGPLTNKSFSKFSGNDFKGSTVKGGNGSVLSISDVGPSPSEVAAAVAAQGRYYYADEASSVGWSLDESEEGLRSKLERWRTELPPVYDRDEIYSLPSSSDGRHARRHTDGGSGLFSCFGNVFGYECSCACGVPRVTMEAKKGGNHGTMKRSPSVENLKRGY